MSKFNLKDLCRQEDGATVVTVAFLMLGLLGFAAFAIDLSYAYVMETRLQATADSAALAAIRELPDANAAATTAQTYAAKNMSASSHGTVLDSNDIVVGVWDTSTRAFTAGGAANAVQLTMERSQDNGNAAPTFFANLLGRGSVDISASATAFVKATPKCIMALNPTVKSSIKLNGGGVVTDKCRVHANSSHGTALDIASGGSLIVPAPGDITVVGGYDNDGTVSPTPYTGQNSEPDPMAGWTPPTPPGGCTSADLPLVLGEGTHTLNPGVYCGGIDADSVNTSTVTFEPGIYYMEGPLLLNNTNVSGDGVAFYMTDWTPSYSADYDGSVIRFGGNGTTNLSAPTSGPMAGVLFYADVNAPTNLSHNIQGNSTLYLEGTIYAPSHELKINGNGVVNVAPFTNIIADTLKFSSDTALTFNYDRDGSAIPLPDGMVNAGSYVLAM